MKWLQKWQSNAAAFVSSILGWGGSQIRFHLQSLDPLWIIILLIIACQLAPLASLIYAIIPEDIVFPF